jgi:hypothetical protein
MTKRFREEHRSNTLPRGIIDAVRSAAPAAARKRTWFVTVCEDITIPYRYWSSGSRADYSAATTFGGIVELPQASAPDGHLSHPSTWDEPVYTIPDGVVVVQAGISRGKTTAPTVHINKATAARLGL